MARVRQALRWLPPERLFLNPDCGFGTFASRPMSPHDRAAAKLRSIGQAAAELRRTISRSPL